jgi:hypothetical protein
MSATERATKPSRLWLWFVLAFVVQAAAWATWLIIASHHKVAEVPLAESSKR